MKRFDVLDPQTEIGQNYLIEASAGTGKTFSIENIVARLIKNGTCTIDQMLLVTFTRAATRDLKKRIKEKLTEAWEADPDERHLHQALLNFDSANIDTIHGFCSRMLREHVFEGDVSLDFVADQGKLSNTLLQRLIYDFFKTGLTREKYSPAQVRRVRMDLEQRLLFAVKRGIDVVETDCFRKLFERFHIAVKSLPYTSEELILEFDKLYPSYLKMADAEEKVQRFAKLFDQPKINEEDFDQLIEDDLVFVSALHPDRLRKRVKIAPTSQIVAHIEEVLGAIVSEARDPTFIFGRMVHDCLHFVERYLSSEELMRFDDLLKSMRKAVDNHLFASQVQKRYRVMIVDEFQDTDPLQWEIFKTLATGWKGYLYLVGDPKQSIYAFRNADIYTYLDAGSFLGEDAKASLDTNYRSTIPLVNALNHFFSVPDLIPLPRSGTSLPYPPVKSSGHVPIKQVDDEKGALHFCIAKDESRRWSLDTVEREQILPFIVEEISRLNCDTAILVHTRNQGKRVANFLKRAGIPVLLQQSNALSSTHAYQCFKLLLHALANPKNEQTLKALLGSMLIGWNDQQLILLEDMETKEKVLNLCFGLKDCLMQSGFALFIRSFLETIWPQKNHPVTAELLLLEDGQPFYEDFMQLVRLILRRESKGLMSIDAISAFLEELKVMEFEEDADIRRTSDTDSEGVKVMTMHASKGLEFDVVFAIGLLNRSRAPERLIPIGNGELLQAVMDESDPLYQSYAEELDAEKMRLLYVTMTRAKQRVYVPIINAPNTKPAAVGSHSPLDLYLQKLGCTVEDFVQKHDPAEISLSYLTVRGVTPKPQEIHKSIAPPRTITVPGKPRYVQSFSSIARSSHKSLLTPPHDFDCEQKSAHTLPAGSETGTVLHNVLETIPWKRFESPQALLPHLKIPSLFTEWKEVIAEITFNAFNKDLGGFVLADVDPRQVYREVEFLYPTNEGFMKGVIDLAFMHEGKYYLLDWKSNWLGVDDDAYNDLQLHQAMEQHDYNLQASIYQEAFCRYLNLAGEEQFAGVYYLFLRGMGVLFLESMSAANKKVE